MVKLHKIINDLVISRKIFVYLIFALCIGIFSMIAGNKFTTVNKQKTIPSSSNNITVENNNSDENVTEHKLINILKKVDGVGDVDIIINYTSTVEKVPDSNIEGVIVVAQGGDDIYISGILKTTVSDYLGIPIHKINILKMK